MAIWSEVPQARLREWVADAATLAWVALWGWVGWNVHGFVAQFAEAGRAVREGGLSLDAAGEQVASSIAGIPLIGAGAADAVSRAFGAAADPLVAFGLDLERLVLVVAALLALLIVAVPLLPWLTRYLPWRIGRLRHLRAATRVVRRAPTGVDAAQIERLLASRAVHRLDYDELLAYSPDPFGDWAAGRHDRLARAELASVGLRPRP